MPEFLTADGNIGMDDRDDILFTGGLSMININDITNINNFRFSADGGIRNSSSISEIEEDQEDDDEQEEMMNNNYYYNDHRSCSLKIRDRIPATIKEMEFEGMSGSSSSLCSSNNNNNNIYVVVLVGMKNAVCSMDALRWSLENLVINSPSNFIYLIHIFPEVRQIPSPLGMLAKEQVSPKQVENYMKQQNIKRREFLGKFMNMCSTFKVKVETLLVESDNTSKAVLDLILILNITRLVMGATKSTLRELKRGNGICGDILKNASDTCEIKIICEGKEVMPEQLTTTTSSASSPRPSTTTTTEFFTDINNDQKKKKKKKKDKINGHQNQLQKQDEDDELTHQRSLSPCTCFPTKFI